jgi:hypothetical protein
MALRHFAHATIPAGMFCEEKNRLIGEYQIALAAYSEAISRLDTVTGVGRHEEYNNLHRLTEVARGLSDRALSDLERHVSTHGCGEEVRP